MEITVIGRNDHSRYLAEEYDKRGILNEYYNFYYYKDNMFGKIIKRFNGNIEYINRGTKIEERKVKNFIIHKFLSKIVRSLLFFSKNKFALESYICDNLYDLYNSLRIKKSDVYHVWSQYSFFTMKAIKRKYSNSTIILELFAAHPIYRKEIYDKNGEEVDLYEKFLIKKINKEIKLADIVLVPSNHVKESIINQVDGIDNKIIVVPYASNNKFFYPMVMEKKTKGLELLYVGQISRKKGVNYLIDAVNKLNEELEDQLNLTLIGQVIDIKIESSKNIKYEGIIPNNKLVEYYNKCDVFVFPSLSESCGLVLGEAMSCKKPVITTRNASWIIKNEYDGLIIRENSLDELIEAIKKISDYNLRNKMGNNAFNSVNKYSWGEYLDDFSNQLITQFDINIFS